MLKIEIYYPITGHTRAFSVTQGEANKMITMISNLNEKDPVDLKITVGERW